MNLYVCPIGTRRLTEVGEEVERVLIKEVLKKRLRPCGQFDRGEAGHCGPKEDS